MLFIQNGLHMVAIREGSILCIQPNPNFKVERVEYAAIKLNDQIIGVYPMPTTTDTKTVFEVFTMIMNNVGKDGVISLPKGYVFKTIEEFEQFKTSATQYSKQDMINIYYDCVETLNKFIQST